MATYQDIDIYGELNPSGELKTYTGEDAVKNALQLWLSSKKGEYLLNPGLGGPLDAFSFKTMNEESLTILKFKLMSAIDTEFTPAIRLTNVLFNPDFQNRILEIILAYQIEDTGEQGEVTVFTNTQYSYKNFNYEDILEVGENLKSFFTIKKPSMTDKRLLFDNEGSFWKWGKYKLVNLTPFDPCFEDILIIANT